MSESECIMVAGIVIAFIIGVASVVYKYIDERVSIIECKNRYKTTNVYKTEKMSDEEVEKLLKTIDSIIGKK